MAKAIITTSWDDGHRCDLRLAELLQKHGVPATFYIPIDNIERSSMTSEQVREIAQSFDVGGHTYRHVDLTRVSLREAQREIIEGKKRLQETIGRDVPSFCYPKGRFNDRISNIVSGAGFIGARTVKLLTRSIKDPFKIGTTVYAKDLWFAPYVKQSIASSDPSMFSFMLRNNLFFKAWDRIAIETLGFVAENGGVWHIWGHSWEIDDNSDWGRLDEVLRIISTLYERIPKMNNSQLYRNVLG